ncbi:ubiquitin carboxyl-terminal hydrolase 23 isoform X2 [Magnolia sinica]|uniref:ubiquitin carboxyl-terminal hydrolase 23 isoform X2 n=1 Tax=Magnolia sinica TaxID=86752 RepID=UPI00265A301F|nr:ubiquitin carboxyl-terminal hydrolase 23 isoform X2 [Magnolia sinica]
MAKISIFHQEVKKSGDGFSIPAPKDPLFQRRIEFHPARKAFSPFSSNGGDFHLETLNPTSSDSQRPGLTVGGQSVGAGKRSDGGGEFFENGLDPELSFSITVRRIGAGLANLGNTCFLNSVLQCLTYTEPFAAYLQSGKHKSSCHTAGFCALCAIQNHVRAALESTGKILSPLHLVKNLRCISRNFRNARQEDAHEYMVNLLESMHKCCLPSGVSSESPSAYEKSLVHKIFGGRLRSQVKCTQCSFCSNKFDPFLDLSLEIVKADSLSKALAHFTAREQLDGGEKQYQCQRCKEKVKALKQLTIHKAPYVLTIHLKRFGSHVPGQKINKKVDFGPTLDLKPFASDPREGDLKYTLYGVLVHAGWSTHSGHYYCFVRTSSGMWYSLDDNQVVQVSERTVLEQKAYMLFYVRDKRSSSPKKPLDVVRKENMAVNATGNKEIPVSAASPSKQTTQNGKMEKRFTSKCSDSISKTDTLTSQGQPFSSPCTSLKDSVSKKVSASQASGLGMAERLQQFAPSKDPKFDPSSRDSTPKEPSLKDPSVSGNTTEGPLTENGYKTTSLPDDATVAKQSSKIDPGSVHRSSDHNNNGSSKNSSVLVAPRNDQNEFQNTSLTEPVTANGRCESGDLLNGSSPHDTLCQSTGENDTQLEETISIKLSSQSGDASSTLQKKAIDTTCATLKPKKLLKFRTVKCLHFGPKGLFLASLSLRKRKKHKRSKRRHNLDSRKLIQKALMEDSISSDQGTSTSGKAGTVDHGSTHVQDRQPHSVLNNGKSHGIAKDVTDCNGGFLHGKERGPGERSGPSSAVLATDELSEKSLSSATKQCDSRETDFQGKRGSIQHGLMSMLTRGLEEVTVARWDDIELLTSEFHKSNDNGKSNIGYVLDEWDEEYDRGKRKKVRKSAQSFDGSNPFQEFAMEKAQRKKIKMMDRISAGNRPFRI